MVSKFGPFKAKSHKDSLNGSMSLGNRSYIAHMQRVASPFMFLQANMGLRGSGHHLKHRPSKTMQLRQVCAPNALYRVTITTGWMPLTVLISESLA